jgi:hypothetical protein
MNLNPCQQSILGLENSFPIIKNSSVASFPLNKSLASEQVQHQVHIPVQPLAFRLAASLPKRSFS